MSEIPYTEFVNRAAAHRERAKAENPIRLRYWEKCALYVDGYTTPIVFDDHASTDEIVLHAKLQRSVHSDVRVIWNDDYRGRQHVESAARGER